MHWIVLAITTSIFFGVYYFFIKIASAHINEVLGAVLLQIVATFVGLCLILYLKFAQNMPFQISGKGILYSCLAGISIGLAEVLTFFVYTKGAPVSVGSPIIIGGSIVTVAVLGFLYLGDAINFKNMLALILILAGVILFTTQQDL